MHTCDFDVERNLCPGEDFYVTALDTALGQVQVGGMICYDREFPESARILMLKGTGADPGSQCLSHGAQPPFPAACQSLRKYGGDCHLQLPGDGA
ncbi:MAG: nitrilase-related carbon-nitrogen hydrolase [Oscillospiraceae bacterium]